MTKKSYIDAFDPDALSETVCVDCGICLQNCPVMQMEAEESIEEHACLIRGKTTKRVLNECNFCYACNSVCPHGLKPYALIMQRASEAIMKSAKGIPSFIQYLYTGHGGASIFSDVYQMLPNNEQAILDKWESPPPPSQEVLFIGCIGREIPYDIENSQTLAGLNKFGPRIACCGEVPFRMGDFEKFSQTVERSFQLLKQLDTDRLICYCGSCSHSFKNIWKDYLGVQLPFEILSIWEWLWEKVSAGKLVAKRPVNKRVAITDSCYSSELGDGFFEAIRGLHKAVGMEVVELENNKYDNLCCGAMCASKNDFDLTGPLIAAEIKMNQVIKTGVTDLDCYCPGCLTQLYKPGKNANIQVRYALEEILWAMGDEISLPLRKRMALQGKLFIEKIKSA